MTQSTPADAAVRVGGRALAAALGRFAPTEEQLAVIEAPLGPALVVAGAGSGKTETMAARVVWLVANGFARRHEILGLTFTRKAAGELAERIAQRLDRLAEFEHAGLIPHLDALFTRGALDAFVSLEQEGSPASARRAVIARLAEEVALGADGAVPRVSPSDELLDRPVVGTYNGFADQLVREHGVRIGRDPDAAVLSDSTGWLLMRRIVLASDDERLGEVDRSLGTVVSAARALAGAIADNRADVAEVAAFAERFRGVRDRPSESARVTVYADVAAAVERVDALELLSSLVADYQRVKAERGLIDFSDQVAAAVDLLEAAPDVVHELRERHRVVLLDEYQDTSAGQSDLLRLLFHDHPVMAVGDPNQAIYGWRGASAGNLADFEASFGSQSGCRRYTLLTSWRNASSILRAADAVLSGMPDDQPVRVDGLISRPGAPAGQVSAIYPATLDEEAEAVAEWFARLRERAASRGAPPSGAILFRAKKHMPRFADALAARGIPHRIVGLGGLLETPEVVDIVCALAVISDPHAGNELLRLLAGGRWAIGVADLRALRELARRLTRREDGTRLAGDDEVSLVEALDFFARTGADHAWLSGFTVAARERLREAAGVFAGLRQAGNAPVTEVIRLIEKELRLDIELVANEARGPARTATAHVRAFIDAVSDFLGAAEATSIPAVLAWIEQARSGEELATVPEPPEPGVVQLLSIHASKGLEWDAVAVARLVDGELPATARESKGWLSYGVLPYELRRDAAWLPQFTWQEHLAPTQQALRDALAAFVDAGRARHAAEERRLAYVAVTRARSELLLSGSSWASTVKPRQASPFLTDIVDALAVPFTPVDPGSAAPEPPPAPQRLWPPDVLGIRRHAVTTAAGVVRESSEHPALPPDDDLLMLLAEREERRAGTSAHAPARIPASAYKDFLVDYAAAVARVERPLPERPYRQTRVGTLFHSWVERHSGMSGAGNLDDSLWDEGGAEENTAPITPEDRAELDRLIQAFLASEWATLTPLAVESEIDFRLDELDGRGHVIVCKLDAVYERDGRIEIVDWKTGRAPANDQETAERMVQLDLYRRAYHAKTGVPLSRIDVVLYYVAHGVVVRG